jgi:hypothetical protein
MGIDGVAIQHSRAHNVLNPKPPNKKSRRLIRLTWRARTMPLLSHGRISKSSEPLRCESVGRRGWRRFDGRERKLERPSLRKSQTRDIERALGTRVQRFLGLSDEGERRQHCLRGLKPQGPGVFGES